MGSPGVKTPAIPDEPDVPDAGDVVAAIANLLILLGNCQFARDTFLRARFFNLSRPSTRLVRQLCDKTTEH
jgi:hypothetical protein